MFSFLYMIAGPNKKKKKQSKKMCVDVIRSKANESEKLVSMLIVLKRSLG